VMCMQRGTSVLKPAKVLMFRRYVPDFKDYIPFRNYYFSPESLLRWWKSGEWDGCCMLHAWRLEDAYKTVIEKRNLTFYIEMQIKGFIKWILKKRSGVDCVQIARGRDHFGGGGGSCDRGNGFVRSVNGDGVSELAEGMSASRDGFCFVKLVFCFEPVHASQAAPRMNT
jgi:hypothetical protein